MDIRAIISKLDNISSLIKEEISLDSIMAAVGQEKSEQKRAAILQQMAAKENLPGLYDPVSGYFVSSVMDRNQMTQQETPRISATASADTTKKLADMGLVPNNANTRALGGLVGVGGLFKSGAENDKMDQDVKTTSRNAAAAKQIAGLIKQGNDVVAKIDAVKESFNFKGTIAKSLAESLGYTLDEAESPAVAQAQAASTATPPAPAGGVDPKLMAELDGIMAKLADMSPNGDAPGQKELQDKYLAIKDRITKAAEAEKQKADQQKAQDEANKSTAEGLQKKIARLKELLEKLKTKKGGAAGADAGGAATAVPGAKPKSALDDPRLKTDTITQNAKPKESMSEAEKIAQLRDQLLMLEHEIAVESESDVTHVYLDESGYVWDQDGELLGKHNELMEALPGVGALKTGWNALKNVGANFMGGLKGQAAKGVRDTATGRFTKAGGVAKAANRTGKFIKNNPVKTAVGTAAAGAAVGYQMGKDDKPEVSPTPTPGPGPGPAPTPGPSPTPGPAPDPAPGPTPGPTPQEPGDDPDMAEIGQLMSDIGQYTNPQESPADAVEAATKALADAQATLKTLGYTK